MARVSAEPTVWAAQQGGAGHVFQQEEKPLESVKGGEPHNRR